MLTRPDPNDRWQVQDRFVEMHSRWLTLIGEHLLDHQGKSLEYWRVEKADSLIVLPIQADRILLPPASYRPGIGQVTKDFPGGRFAEGQEASEVAIAILQRELGVEPGAIERLSPLNTVGWAVNSSFSNQKLYGFVARIQAEVTLPSEFVAETYAVEPAAIHQLLQALTCLQCRMVLLEWWLQESSPKSQPAV